MFVSAGDRRDARAFRRRPRAERTGFQGAWIE
jgi:hypothetical protein